MAENTVTEERVADDIQMIEIYTFVRHIDGVPYGGHIPARSFEEAQELCPFEIDGKLIAEYDMDGESLEPEALLLWNGEIH